MGRGKANGLGGLEGGVQVSLWVKFGGVLWTEEEGFWKVEVLGSG